MLTMAVPSEDATGPGEDIDKLALRISLADIDDQFEKVVQKSLVFILKYLAKYEDHRKKLMELLGDVTRRLKHRPNIQVPVHELFLTYNDPARQVFLVNFSHLYIVLGYPRLPFPRQVKLLPVLYASLTDDKPICQRDALLHLTLPFIGNITPELVPRDLGLSELPLQRNFIMDFYSLVLLAPYSIQRLNRFDGGDVIIPDGFNSYDLSRVAHERYSTINSAGDLEKYKVGLIQFYSRHFFSAEESIIPILFGYGDSRKSVVSAAAKELRTLSMIVDWEDELLLTRIMAWYLGRRRECDPRGRNEPRRPLSANMRIKLGHYLLRSRITLPGPLAPSLVEAALLALESASVPPTCNNGQQQQQPQQQQQALSSGNNVTEHTYLCEGGCGHAHSVPNIPPNRTTAEENGSPGPTVANNAHRSAAATYSLNQQLKLAEHGLDLLAHLINNVTTLNDPASVAALRCLINFVYEKTPDELTRTRARGFELLSRFLGRDPNYLLKDPAQLPRLFDVLSEDNPTELKWAAVHCLRRLAITFQDAQRQNYPALRGQLSKLERLLYENIEKPDPLCRLVAVNFAGLIYPSDHIPTRYLILQALGDKDTRVREEACMAFEQFLDPNIIHDIVYGRVKLPSFVEFVNHDTQHSRKNPFVEVERLIPVVQFIRLCLLATRGGLTPAQEAALTYETEDEVRYLINQTVRYFLTAGSGTSQSSTSTSGNTSGIASSTSAGHSPAGSPTSSATTGQSSAPLNPEQAKRSIDTYFRLIQVVIFTRSQHTKESPDFPNYLEEVLVGNTKELITCNKTLFDRMNNVLLATPRGANCRHACASVYSVVVMETETATQALQTAKNMLSALPTAGSPIDSESSHAVQGMFMGAAYLLERLFSRHVASNTPSALAYANSAQSAVTATPSDSTATGSTTSTKKSKKEKQQQQKQLRAEIIATIEHLVTLMSGFLIKPSSLFSVPSGSSAKEKRAADGDWYINASVAQSTVSALLEALMVLARAGCLSHLPPGTLPISGAPPNLVSSKAALIHHIASYLPTPATYGGSNSEIAGALTGQPRVAQAALRALAACCMGEGTERVAETPGSNVKNVTVTTGSSSKVGDSATFVSHPHTVHILKLMTNVAEVNDPSLHLAVGTSIADCLLGPTSPLKYHWYERTYPLIVSPAAITAAVASPGGVWLASQLESLLSHRPGQVQTRPATLAAAFWALALVRRMGPPPSSLLPDRLIIDLLEEKDESVQCVAVATLGLIYDRSSEEARTDLVNSLTKTIVGSERRHGSPVYRELCGLAQQIGRPDLALSLIVLAIALPPTARLSSSRTAQQAASNVACNLAASVTYAGLVRRLGRALAPALPRLVPRIFIRRFDYARPRLRQAMENVWLGLVSYASSSATPSLACTTQYTALNLPTTINQSGQSGGAQTTQHQTIQPSPNHAPSNSVHALASEMIEAHFNAIICEIKTQLGFNTPSSTQFSNAITGADSSGRTGPSNVGYTSSSATQSGTGTQNACLRDACCLAIASLTTHPSADKRLAGHLPALLSGLLGLCDEYGCFSQPAAGSSEHHQPTGGNSPPEEAAIAVQKLVIRVLENPCSREAAAGLLPGLLPVIIDRAPWTLGSVTTEMDPTKGARTAQPSESRRLALELLLAAARTARPSALRPALPQLVLAGLHTMSTVHPSLVASLMRQPVHHLHQLHHHHQQQQQQLASSLGTMALPPQTTGSGLTVSVVPGGTAMPQQQSIVSVPTCVTNNKEVQMAEVLRLCVRLIDDVCLSRLVVPFTELIRAGGGSATATIGASSASGGSRGTGAREAAAIATATCVFLSHLAAVNASTLTAHASGRADMCLRCSSSNAASVTMGLASPTLNTGESPAGSPHKLHPSPCGSAHSSPPSTCALSPSASAIHNPTTDGNVLHNLDAVGNPVPPVTTHRVLIGGSNHASTPGLGAISPTTVFVGGSGTSTAGSGGGGFASLVPHTGKLLAALLSALPGACRHPESAGKTVQGEMARTLANLLRFAKDTSVAKLFNRVRSWYLNPEPTTCTNAPSSISISHWACARVLHAVAHHCPDLLYAHAGITLPLIFLNKQKEPDTNCLIYSKVLRDASYPINLPLVQNPCSLIVVSMETEMRISTGTVTLKNNNNNGTAGTDEAELLKPSWQETWDELVSKTPTTSSSPHSAHLPCLPIAFPCGTNLCSPVATGFIDQFLHRPLLDHCAQLIQDALLDSPSWSVRTQAACALLYLCTRLLGYGALFPQSGKSLFVRRMTTSTRSEDGQATELKDAPPKESNDASTTVPEDRCPGDSETSSPEVKEVMNAVEEWASYAWNLIAQLTSKTLNSCKPWGGKVYLLRTARLLAIYAREHGLTVDSTYLDTIEQLWSALVRETRAKRAEPIGPGYQIEAFLSLAVFAEVFDKDAIHSTNENESSTDRLNDLCQLLVPLWAKRDKHGVQPKHIAFNPELNDLEQDLGISAVGIMWPITNVSESPVAGFGPTMTLLSLALTRGAKRVHGTSLASIIAVLTKLNNEQSTKLVQSVDKKSSSVLQELGLHDILSQLRRIVENPKLEALREHVLGCVAALSLHPSFVALCRDQLTQLLQALSREGSSNFNERAAEMLKNLQL